MRKLIAFLVSLFVVLILLANPQVRPMLIRAFTYNQCATPIAYRLGLVDSQFGLSQTDILADISQAANIWSTAENKTLFTYDPKAKLTVNFVYDQRSALNSQIGQLQEQLHQKDTTLSQQIQVYKQASAAFEQKIAQFRERLKSLNGQPVSQDEYNDLINQQKKLQQEGDALNQRASQLNLETHDYNSSISTLNQDANQLNEALAQKPEEGLYDGGKDTITIYFADNHDELVHTLAHELGHAMGMNHVQDPQAIMYPNTTAITMPAPRDLQKLQYVCRDQNALFYWFEQFDFKIIDLIQQLTQHTASR